MSVTFTAQACPLELDVNMSNSNAARVSETLGFSLDPDWCGDMPAPDFKGRVLLALALAPTDEGMPSYEHVTGPNSARFIEGARAPGYLQERLTELLALAEWAVSNGKEVWWS